MKKNIKNSGFTLVETLVAIAIFTMSILALISILASGISNTNYAKEKMTASYLAQEGIEYMRNMRDTYVLYNAAGAQAGWDAFNTKLVNSSCTLSSGCLFSDQNMDYNSHSQQMATVQVLFSCGSPCSPLKYDSSTGKYGYASGVASSFTRKITATAVDANQIKVSSTVSWTQGSGIYQTTFSENLFNWAE